MRPHALVRPARRQLLRLLRPRRSPETFALLAIFGMLLLGGPAAAEICPDVECPDWQEDCGCSPWPPPEHETLTLVVSLDPLTATPQHHSTTASATEWGVGVETTTGFYEQRERALWFFSLDSNQRLQMLSNGGVAVVTTGEPASDVDPSTDDYPDAEPVAPGDLEPDTPWSEDPAAADEDEYADDGGPAGPDEPFDDPDEPDETWEPDPAPQPGDPESDASAAEADRALTALAGAQAEVDGQVAAVVLPPSGVDSTGHAATTWFEVSGSVVELNIQHEFSSTRDSLSVTSEIIEEVDPPDESVEASSTSFSSSSETAAACPFRAKVITYNPNGFVQLFEALKAHATPCADYYIVIPPPANAKTRVRKCQSGPGECRRIVDYIRSGGPNFHPVAEFHWQGWSKVGGWSWQRRGMEFRKRMRAAGYEVARGETWAINEFPSTLRYRSSTRANAMAAARGLFNGFRGYADATGIPFLVNMGQHTVNFSVYKPRLRNLTQAAGFWNTMRRYVRFWGQETYTNCYRSCVPGYGAATRAKYVNAFVQHPARFSYAGGSESAAARSFYVPRYFSLLGGFWGVPKEGMPESGSEKYGWTKDLTAEQMKGLVSLQVYSVRRWAQTHPYSAGRIGIAWNDRQGNTEFQALAERIAQAIQAAYGNGGTALEACRNGADADHWCTRSVPRENPDPAKVPRFNPGWETFTRWR